MLRSLILVIGLSLALLGCDALTGKITPESVAAEIAKDCPIVVNIGDIAALITANPTVAGVSAFAKMVCDAFNAQRAARSGEPPKAGSLNINGVDVHYVVK